MRLSHSMRQIGDDRRNRERGFTLVELLVVITIIAILAALLIPAVFIAVRKAKEARIALEIAAISKALENYKLEMGEYPPDFAYAPGAGDPEDQIAAQINAHLIRSFRRRSPTTDLPQQINLATGARTPIAAATDYAKLDPAEAVYFWLQGFSSDPSSPLAGEGDRTPFFEFDRTRLTDSDSDGFLEYHPKGDSNRMPYVYYSARKSASGSDAEAYLQVRAYLVDAGRVWDKNSNPRGWPVPYFVPIKVPHPSGTPQNSGAAPNSFQLLCAGLDGQFGAGDFVTSAGPVPAAEKDNMTSFSEGRKLGDLVE